MENTYQDKRELAFENLFFEMYENEKKDFLAEVNAVSFEEFKIQLENHMLHTVILLISKTQPRYDFSVKDLYEEIIEDGKKPNDGLDYVETESDDDCPSPRSVLPNYN